MVAIAAKRYMIDIISTIIFIVLYIFKSSFLDCIIPIIEVIIDIIRNESMKNVLFCVRIANINDNIETIVIINEILIVPLFINLSVLS